MQVPFGAASIPEADHPIETHAPKGGLRPGATVQRATKSEPDVNCPTEEKFLIIGAGCTGLAMARQMQRAGWAYEHVEAGPRLGGNWAHGVHNAIELVSPRHLTGFPEFPMDRRLPRYPTGAQMLEYLERYARHFQLDTAIQFNEKVVHAAPAEHEKWRVRFASGRECVYKGLVVCNGHHWDRRWPEIDGNFTGEFRHARDYRSADDVAGRRVLVIGGGNSACDIVTAAARWGKKADLSLRRGYWFMPKSLFGLSPVSYVRPWLSIPLQKKLLRRLLRLYWGPYERYGLPEPDHDVFERHPTINSTVLPLIRAGKIAPRPAVTRFEGNTAHFADGTAASYDTVYCATGYHVSVPFLAPGIFSARGPVAQLHGGAVPEGYRHLYVVATAQVRSGVGAVLGPYVEHVRLLMELQERIALPLGTVLAALGDRPASTHLLDPHLAVRKMKQFRATVPEKLEDFAARLAHEGVTGRHTPRPMPSSIDGDMRVN